MTTAKNERYESTLIVGSQLTDDMNDIGQFMTSYDKNGQLVYLTGIYKWKDGTHHTEAEDDCDDEEEES